MSGETIERARGRWREILPQLGIDTRFLTNKHGPCPLCGGKDRYRFDDRRGEGTYYCNQCGPGTGLILLRKKHGWCFKSAVDEIDRIIRASPRQPTPPKAQVNNSREAAIKRALAEAEEPAIVDAYLRRRGLTISPPVLRGHARCPYFDDAHKLVGHYPAVLAPITGPDGSLQSAQRIYDADLDPRKKVLPPVETINGAVVRLFELEHNQPLGLAEGVETAIAAHELSGIPVWAAVSANGIRIFRPPPGLKRLHIFADNDRSHTGQAAAYALSHQLIRAGIEVEVHIPKQVGNDWLDELVAP